MAAASVSWADSALEDLRGIVEGIGKDAPGYAATFVKEGVRAIQTMAHLGRTVPEMGNPDIREIVIRSVRLIYRACREGPVVLAILPCAGNVGALWRRQGTR
ncbi:MAG: type II toxin-antitoxin system RelE/ParE family toxin [Planctomycetes bacterium]|nr:type II toxin-antitoxin system RelE/ParE family toxin [Planctomycetota bacterium]